MGNALYRHMIGVKLGGRSAVAAVAAAVGRAEAIVRDWASGRLAMPEAAVAPTARVLGRAYAAEVIGADENGWNLYSRPHVAPTPEELRASALRAQVAAARLAETVERATADGVITDAELAEIAEAATAAQCSQEKTRESARLAHEKGGRCMPVRRAVVK